MNYQRFRAVFRKEARHILRDPRSLLAALAIPVVMIMLFGYALTLDVDRIPTIILDQDHTPQSRNLADDFAGSRYFTVTRALGGYEAIVDAINQNRAMLAVVIPRGFSRTLARSEEAKVQLILDGSDSNTASIAAGYAEALVLAHAVSLRDKALKSRGMGDFKMPVDARIRVLYNHEMKSKNFIIPGIIAVVLMIIAALLTSLTIAREWESGTMEQLLSTPLRPAELLLGKLCAYFVLGMADVALALLIGLGVFDVPMRGNPFFVVFTSGLFLFGALCWGIFISTITRSQLLAFQASIISSFLPAFLLSGFIYSIENMPLVIQQITRIVPSRYFVTILQGVFLKGTGLQVLWLEVLVLAVYAAVVFLLASRAMKQKVA
jgi:ABC-2 type transport system permease protein